MYRKRILPSLIGLALLAAACAPAPDGAPAADPTDSTLLELADAVEAAAPSLDVVQVERNDEDNLVVVAIQSFLDVSQSEAVDLIRNSTETVWEAALEYTPEVPAVYVAYLRVVPVNTLEYGPAKGGWLVGAVLADVTVITPYLATERTPEIRSAFWDSETVAVITLDQSYLGTPNHPLREASLQP